MEKPHWRCGPYGGDGCLQGVAKFLDAAGENSKLFLGRLLLAWASGAIDAALPPKPAACVTRVPPSRELQ